MIMKKNLLSCLSLLLVMLVSGAAFAQPAPSAFTQTITNPYTSQVVTASGALKKVEHIRICVTDPRPIDLTYDVLGVHLPAEQGGWEFRQVTRPITHPGNPAPFGENDYDGRNVFKAIDPEVGTYLFVFKNKLTGNFCGLSQGDSLYAYVHVLPNMPNQADQALTVCKGTAFPTISETGLTATDLQVIANAGYAIKATPWQPTGNTPAPFPATVDSTLSYNRWVMVDHIVAGTDTTFYPCDNVDSLNLVIVAADSIDLTNRNKVETVCRYQFPANITTADDLKAFFGIGDITVGSWAAGSVPVNWATDFPVGTNTKTYTYTIPTGTCHVAGNFVFTINIVERFDSAYGVDTATCKTSSTANLIDFLNFGTASIASWTSIGTNPASPGSFPSGGDPMISSGVIDYSKFNPSIPYYFVYTLKDSTLTNFCYQGGTDTIVVTVLTGAGGKYQDGRIQICNTSGAALNLNTLMGMPSTVTWTPVGSAPGVTAGVINIGAGVVNTYKYTYAIPADECGSGANGVFYVKSTGKVVAPKSIEEKFCVENLPSSFNVFYIAGMVSGALEYGNGTIITVDLPGGGTVSKTDIEANYLNTTTGEFDLAKFIKEKYSTPFASGDEIKFTFKIDNPACMTGDVEVKVILTTNII